VQGEEVTNIELDSTEVSQMEWKDVESRWNQFKGKVQQRWGKLTGDDIDEIAGSYQQLVGKLQEKYGITQQQAERELEEFQNTVRA
jgi:uncharacterized protein YjbJ (UPF0337 family)